MATWKEIVARHRAAVPKGSSIYIYSQAMKAASREYHSQEGVAPRRRSTNMLNLRRGDNPIRFNNPKTILLLLVGGYLAYTQFIKPKQDAKGMDTSAAKSPTGFGVAGTGPASP